MVRHTLFTTQKNEGAFLLEWLAFHSVIGFDNSVIVSNDCDDGSDELLDALSNIMPLIHIRQKVGVGQNAQHSGQALARETGALVRGDWIAWMDPDEFLNSHIGHGSVAELTDALGDAQAIVMNWRLFGSSGVQKWPGLQLDPRFHRCGTAWHKSARYCKTLFKYDENISQMNPHRPSLHLLERERDDILWLDSEGEPLPWEYVLGKRASGGPHYRTPRRPKYRWVQVNHYMVRTRQLYALRQSRGRGDKIGRVVTRKGRRYTWMHYQKHNCNILSDKTIHKHVPALQAKINDLLSCTAVREAHRACLAANGLL